MKVFFCMHIFSEVIFSEVEEDGYDDRLILTFLIAVIAFAWARNDADTNGIFNYQLTDIICCI
jgi:hypothetical protein